MTNGVCTPVGHCVSSQILESEWTLPPALSVSGCFRRPRPQLGKDTMPAKGKQCDVMLELRAVLSWKLSQWLAAVQYCCVSWKIKNASQRPCEFAVAPWGASADRWDHSPIH